MELLFATSIFSLENRSFLPSSQRARKWLTFFNKYGASTSSLHFLSMLCIAPSSLLYSDKISLPRNTGIIWQVGKRFSYACQGKTMHWLFKPTKRFLENKTLSDDNKDIIRYKSSKPPPMTQFLITQFYFKRLGTLYMKRLIYNYLAIWKPLRS